jgi:hypothetical protein
MSSLVLELFEAHVQACRASDAHSTFARGYFRLCKTRTNFVAGAVATPTS